MDKIGSVVGWVAFIVGINIVDGWVVSNLWRWFVAEPFGVRPIGIAHAVGVCILVGAVTFKPSNPGDVPSEKLINRGIVTALVLMFLLGSGWVVHRFM